MISSYFWLVVAMGVMWFVSTRFGRVGPPTLWILLTGVALGAWIAPLPGMLRTGANGVLNFGDQLLDAATWAIGLVTLGGLW